VESKQIGGETMSKNKPMPFHMGVLLTAVAVSAVTFAVAAAMTEYAFIKPFVTDLVFAQPNLKTEELAFNFDPANVTYPSLRVTVKNCGSQSASGTIHVYLYDSGVTRIATGQTSVNLAAGDSATVTVALSWSQGKNTVDVTSGKIVIKE